MSCSSRWGNTLSKKLFKGKEYVLKHIRVKHAHVLEDQVNMVSTQVLKGHAATDNDCMHGTLCRPPLMPACSPMQALQRLPNKGPAGISDSLYA